MKNIRIIGCFLALSVFSIFFADKIDGQAGSCYDISDYDRASQYMMQVGMAYGDHRNGHINGAFSGINKFLHSLSPGVKAVIAAIGAVPAAYAAYCVADFCSMRYFDSITQLENEDYSNSASIKQVICTYLIACFTGLPIFATYLAGVYAATAD